VRQNHNAKFKGVQIEDEEIEKNGVFRTVTGKKDDGGRRGGAWSSRH